MSLAFELVRVQALAHAPVLALVPALVLVLALVLALVPVTIATERNNTIDGLLVFVLLLLLPSCSSLPPSFSPVP